MRKWKEYPDREGFYFAAFDGQVFVAEVHDEGGGLCCHFGGIMGCFPVNNLVDGIRFCRIAQRPPPPPPPAPPPPGYRIPFGGKTPRRNEA